MTNEENVKPIKVDFYRSFTSLDDLQYHADWPSAERYALSKCPTAKFLRLGDVNMVGVSVVTNDGGAIALIRDTSLRPTLENVYNSLSLHECPVERINYLQTLYTLRMQLDAIKQKIAEIEGYFPEEESEK